MAFWDVGTIGRFSPQKAPLGGAMLTEESNKENDVEVSTMNDSQPLCIHCGEICDEALTVRFSRPTDNAMIAKGSACEDCADRLIQRAQDGDEAVPAEGRW